MADCISTRLSKKEATFIWYACIDGGEGVYDFENLTNSEFRKKYKVEKGDVQKMLAALQSKMKAVISQSTKLTTQ